MNEPEFALLIVDDEANILNAIRRMLRQTKVTVFTASSGEEALEIIEKERPAVILSDYRMPGMSGVELLRRAKAMDPDSVRMIISGQSDMDAVLDAINDGEVFRFITKPWIDADLHISINLALAHRRMIGERHELKHELSQLRSLVDVLRELDPDLVARAQSKISDASEPTLRNEASHATSTQ